MPFMLRCGALGFTNKNKLSCNLAIKQLNFTIIIIHTCRGQEIWPFKLGHVFLAWLLCLALFVIFGLSIDTTAHSNAILIIGDDGKSAIKWQKPGLFVVWCAHPKPPISLVQNFLNLYCI